MALAIVKIKEGKMIDAGKLFQKLLSNSDQFFTAAGLQGNSYRISAPRASTINKVVKELTDANLTA